MAGSSGWFLSAASYVRYVLERVVAPDANTIGPYFILMHDNTIPHTARVTRNVVGIPLIRPVIYFSE